MSLHQLLEECGSDDEGFGSDMDVCIGVDPPAAGVAEVLETDDLRAGGTSSQGGGDEARGAVDGTLDPSPNPQSSGVSGGDGARPTPPREEAPEQQAGDTPRAPEQQAGDTPRTPQRGGGGSAAPAPPEASGRAPTVRTSRLGFRKAGGWRLSGLSIVPLLSAKQTPMCFACTAKGEVLLMLS